MRILTTKGTTKNHSVSNVIGHLVHTLLRNAVSLAMVWSLIGSMIVVPNRSQTHAMKASPHAFSVNQDEEDVVLKIKGDEFDHWVTNQHGE